LFDPAPQLSEIRHGGNSHPVHKSFVGDIDPHVVRVSDFILRDVAGPSDSLIRNGDDGSILHRQGKGVIKDCVGNKAARVGDGVEIK
jgi:hypothetical protein